VRWIGINSFMVILKNKKDFKHRLNCSKAEFLKLPCSIIKFYLLNKSLPLAVLNKFCLKLRVRSSKTKIVRYCILTGRNRGNLRRVGDISRVVLRNVIRFDSSSGLKKAVW
jgi:ribosomal protein S14